MAAESSFACPSHIQKEQKTPEVRKPMREA